MNQQLLRFQERCDTAAKWLLVLEFAAFPVFLGLANALLLLILICWVAAGRLGATRKFDRQSNCRATCCVVCIHCAFSLLVCGHTRRYFAAPQ